jgi:hypothetical protein
MYQKRRCLLKKSLSDRSAAQNRSETPRNQGQNATRAAFSAPEHRGTREHEGVFQHAGRFLGRPVGLSGRPARRMIFADFRKQGLEL